MATEGEGGGEMEAGDPSAGESGGLPPDLPIYIQATRECRAPLQGEAPGQSEDGQVCTWQSVGGATEENRRFRDYASCEVVRTQRPYYPVPIHEGYEAEDPRMEDPVYTRELDWVRKQIDATGCTCCHSSAAPAGAVRWSIDLPGHWVSSFNDRDLALMADWLDTSMFERYPADQNNGFIRPHGLPSTDPERVVAFFENEALQRGLTPKDFFGAPPTGGPLLDQAAYEASACTQGEGIAADGRIDWAGGPARYIYVLAVGSDNPTVPPDRDTPQGTLWRIDVPATGEPLLPGEVTYGQVPSGTSQRFPSEGEPVELRAGMDYYLYVTRDMYQPITRCHFTFPG